MYVFGKGFWVVWQMRRDRKYGTLSCFLTVIKWDNAITKIGCADFGASYYEIELILIVLSLKSYAADKPYLLV